MNKFFKKILTFFGYLLGLIILIVSTTVGLNYNHSNDYPAVIKDKYHVLDSLSNENKIIICGGSSSLYSINSELLQETFHKPVINTTLAMDLGSKFHLNLIHDYLKEGDVVLYIPEFEFYYGREEGDEFLYTTAFYYPNMLKDFTSTQKLKALSKSTKLSITYLFNSINKNDEDSYSKQYNRKSFNRLGDNISLSDIDSSLIKPNTVNRYQKLKKKVVSKEFIDFLIDVKNEYESLGVKFIMSFPPVEESQYDARFLEAIHQVQKETDITFIGKPNENVYKANLFYDSSYHLNGLGRSIRMKKLIKNLENNLN